MVIDEFKDLIPRPVNRQVQAKKRQTSLHFQNIFLALLPIATASSEVVWGLVGLGGWVGGACNKRPTRVARGVRCLLGFLAISSSRACMMGLMEVTPSELRCSST